MSIESNVEREEEILSQQLSSGAITREEYNQALRQLYREAREESREEEESREDDAREEEMGLY